MALLSAAGEIFVLDMGQPVRILDLARQMIELSGLKPDEDIRIEFIGVRPGEKLFEELTHQGENFVPTTHAKIFRFIAQPVNLAEFTKTLQTFRKHAHEMDSLEVKKLLSHAIPDYTPFLEPEPAVSRITRLADFRPATASAAGPAAPSAAHAPVTQPGRPE